MWVFYTYSLANAAVVFFDGDLGEGLGFESEGYGAAVAASGVYFLGFRVNIGKFVRKSWAIKFRFGALLLICASTLSVLLGQPLS